MGLGILTLLVVLGLPARAPGGGGPTGTEREILDHLEAEVFGAVTPTGGCSPFEPCGPVSLSRSWLDTPEVVGAGTRISASDALQGARLSGFTLPVVLNEPVREYMRFFQGRGKHILARWLSRLGRHKARLEALLAKEGAPPELVYVAMIESGFDPFATSPVQAVGPWQFMLGTATQYGLRRDAWIDERRSWEKSTFAAARYLRWLEGHFGSWPLALAAYNCGPGTVGQAILAAGDHDFWTLAAAGALPLGTARYVPKIMAAMIIGQDPARYGFSDVVPEPALEVEEVHVAGGLDLRVLARTLELDEGLLLGLNSELRRGFTPPGAADWPLRIPAKARGLFDEHVSVRHIQGRVFEEYSVRFGERLRDVAARFGVTQSALRRLNELPVGEPRAGRTLLVPADPARPRADAAPPLLVRTDPGLALELRGRKELFFPVPDRMEVAEIAAFFGVSSGDVGLWNGLDPEAAVHRGLVLRLLVAADFDASLALAVPPDRVTVVRAGTPAAQNALAHAREDRLPGTTHVSHTVKRGETLWAIAKRYKVSLPALRAENALGPHAAAPPGKVLRVPTLAAPPSPAPARADAKGGKAGKGAKGRYVVQPGDTVKRLAKRFKVSETSLRKRNGIGAAANLRAGKAIEIP